MIISAEQQFSDAQSITITAVSTNKIDLGTTGTVLGAPAALTRDIGKGTPIPIMCQVVDAFTGTGTIQFQVVTDSAADLSTATVVAETKAFTYTTLASGYQISLLVLPQKLTGRYLGLQYTISGTATAGSVSAGIVMGVQTNTVPGRA